MWALRRFGVPIVVLLCLVTVGCGRAATNGSTDASQQQASGAVAGETGQASGESGDGGSDQSSGQGSSGAGASEASQGSAAPSHESNGASEAPTATSTDSGQEATGAPAPSGEQGAVGAPGGRTKSAQAVGAPIKIPSFVTDQGRPLAEVRSEIVSDITRQCGGELCVTLRDEARDGGGYDSCTFWKTEPPQETLVPRGATVTIVSGAGPCATQPPVEGPSPTDSTPPDGTEPSATSSPDTTT